MTVLARFCRISTAIAVLAIPTWLAAASSTFAAPASSVAAPAAHLDPVPHPYDEAWYKALFPDVTFLQMVGGGSAAAEAQSRRRQDRRR
jgi:hypothetical protein